MKIYIQKLALTLALFTAIHQVAAQGTTAFTYQGQLRDGGTNANGTYVMQFKLYDAVTSGNQIGSIITASPTLANGLFTVNLDFGASAFNGAARYLDITVSNGVAQTLSPRVEVLPSPYALYAAVAATVTNGAIMNAQLAGNAVNTTNIQSGAVTNANLTANAVNATNIASGQVVKSFNGLTDAVSLLAGNNVGLFTNSGIVQISSFVPNIQFFHSSSGTFTVPTNVTRIMVEMWGAGGGGGSGASGGNVSTSGGGGGAGAYTMNVFTVTPGSSYSVTAASSTAAGQSGGASSFTGPGISMTAGGGSAGANATVANSGAGGAAGTATGGLFSAGDNGEGGSTVTIYDSTDYNNIIGFEFIGGQGGGVWRGSAGSYVSGSVSAMSGPGGGGGGGTVNKSGNGGNSGVVFVYY